MNWFKSLSVQVKILTIPVVGAIGFCSYLVISLMSMSQTVALLDDAYHIEYRLLQTSEFGLVRLDKIKETLANAATMGESDLIDDANAYAQSIKDKFQETSQADATNAPFLRQWVDDFSRYYSQASKLSSQMVDGSVNFDTLADTAGRINDELNAIENSLKEFQETRYQAFTHAFDGVSKNVERTSNIGIIVGVITIVILFAVAVPIATSSKRSLIQIIRSMKSIAQENGDLTVRINTESKDEIGELVFWFNSFIEKLQGVIKNVVDTAIPLADTAHHINDLSNKTIDSFTRQSDSVMQSRHSVGEMSQSVGEVTTNAADAANAARSANEEADKGKAVVQETVTGIRNLADNVSQASDAVNQLQEDTNKVNVVLDVIKGIAEQTNLLALNAAIEAARAGEQGRGFAVVADEVRNLASRTQESTEEINQMLEQLQSAANQAVAMMESSKAKVDQSVESANGAGASLEVINDSVNIIADMNGAIAVATEEQNQVSGLMVGYVEDIQACADEASGASNEVATVSDELTRLASELASVAKQFKV